MVYTSYMTKLNIPPAEKGNTKSKDLQFNGLTIRTGTPENYTGSSKVIDLLKKGMRNGAFKGLEETGNGQSRRS